MFLTFFYQLIDSIDNDYRLNFFFIVEGLYLTAELRGLKAKNIFVLLALLIVLVHLRALV